MMVLSEGRRSRGVDVKVGTFGLSTAIRFEAGVLRPHFDNPQLHLSVSKQDIAVDIKEDEVVITAPFWKSTTQSGLNLGRK